MRRAHAHRWTSDQGTHSTTMARGARASLRQSFKRGCRQRCSHSRALRAREASPSTTHTLSSTARSLHSTRRSTRSGLAGGPSWRHFKPTSAHAPARSASSTTVSKITPGGHGCGCRAARTRSLSCRTSSPAVGCFTRPVRANHLAAHAKEGRVHAAAAVLAPARLLVLIRLIGRLSPRVQICTLIASRPIASAKWRGRTAKRSFAPQSRSRDSPFTRLTVTSLQSSVRSAATGDARTHRAHATLIYLATATRSSAR